MKFLDFLAKNRREFLVLNLLALVLYTVFCVLQGFPLSEEVMFSSTDSRGYLEVSNWFYWGEETNYLVKRPLLYPVMIGVPYLLWSHTGIWLFQIVCWFVLINFVFFGIRSWINSALVAWIASVMVLLNFTLIALTFHALTEVVTATLLASLFYFVAYNRKRRKSLFFIHGVLLFLVALTLVKPLFYYPLLIVLISLPFFYLTLYRRCVLAIVKLVVILIPLIAQMTLVKSETGKFQVSAIGSDTFTNYYFAQCVREIEGLNEKESIDFARDLAGGERSSYMKKHAATFIGRFFENIDLNIKAEPVFLKPQNKEESRILYDFMTHYNRGTFLVHLIGLLLMIVSLIVFWRRRDYENLIVLILIGGMSTYFICTSGISFWQGDRLVVPAIALWAPLYCGLLFCLVKLRKRQKKM